MLTENLKRLIEEKEISVSELSRKTGVPKSTILSWLAGRTPDLHQLDKVAQYFKSNIEYLAFGRKQEDILSNIIEKIEVHSGLYEITVKKVVKKEK